MSHVPIRVLLLDPSEARRARLQQLLERDAALQLVAAVARPLEAIELAARRRADVIVLGEGAVVADSLRNVRSIMEARATPIVVVCGASLPVEHRHAFAYMEAGALAVLRDPGIASGPDHEDARRKLLESTRAMAEVKVVRRWAALAATTPPPAKPPVTAAPVPTRVPVVRGGGSHRIELVAIGASTGGPVALKQLLCALPAGFPVPIIIVQHMADGFLDGLADWLSASCAVRTEVAGRGTVLQPGRAYLAPDGHHMRVTPGHQLAFDSGPPINGHRPAVGCLLASVAAHYGPRAIGVLLTGMGRDGAAELKLMKDCGATTFAQDAESSVVHGMPGEAIRLGGATHVMTPEEIGAALPALVLRPATGESS
jgi:two-component system chemotaxis response regulator CheB